MVTDEQLMLAFVDGDDDALAMLYARYRARLTASLVRRTGSRSDADDLVQQTFLRLFHARSTYRPGELVRPWIFAIAHNIRRDGERSRARRPFADACEIDSLTAANDTVRPLEQAETTRLLRRALATLTPALRTTVEHHWLEEREFGEVAAILGVREGTLRVRAFRAVHSLRELLPELESA
jgi:RNA polymerase sigma-70 factor (ECF subfamily)